MKSKRILIFFVSVFALLIVSVLVAASLATSGGSSSATLTKSQTTKSTTQSHSTFEMVAPETTVPQDTPVQQQYDQGFENSFANNMNQFYTAEHINLPSPEIQGNWPNLSNSNSASTWTTEFIKGLLDINFQSQTRIQLGNWLVAEEAPNLLPGWPVTLQDKALYTSVLYPGATGQTSPIPSASTWKIDSSQGVSWSVSGLNVTTDSTWQSMVDAGWQPRDVRMTTEDVSGVLKITDSTTSSNHYFTLTIVVGSALWHQGYGTVLIGAWTVA
ncbi:MAG: hypothetical protein HKL80_05585 [Acidimicrobiales bacterium]|nr:hypothetical protein [Acidimicrobiales bacterium]